MSRNLFILGIRGIPAQHGGFETFAEYLSLYLISKHWNVTVYCQEYGNNDVYQTNWKGITLIHIPVSLEGSLGTIAFDIKSIVHSLRYRGVFLTLGYNTALFNILYRIKQKPNVINMDGIEWKRQKWGLIGKTWFWLNERLGCWFGNELIADHPCIVQHLSSRASIKKITMIPYGGRKVSYADEKVLLRYDLKKKRYAILIARPEPENSILELVTAFSNKQRNAKLVILGEYNVETNPYHKMVAEAASNEVLFIGAIYKPKTLDALRYFARIYVHGHQVGGTNPSLVEALGAGNAVLAHDNKFNRWVAKDAAIYFDSTSSASQAFDKLLNDDKLISSLERASNINFENNFKWEEILQQYEKLLFNFLPQ